MGLVSLYKLEEANGTRVDTIGGHNLTEVINDSVAAATGKIGNALNADAFFGHVSNTAALPPWDGSFGTDDFSYTLWLNFTQHTVDLQFAMRLGGAAGGRIANVFRELSGRLNVEIRSAGQNYQPTSLTTLTNGLWYHVAVVYERGVEFRFYINGALDNTPVAASDSPLKSMGADPMVRLGADALGLRGMNGVVDEVAFFDHALTGAEVSAHYNGGSGVDLGVTGFTYQRDETARWRRSWTA